MSEFVWKNILKGILHACFVVCVTDSSEQSLCTSDMQQEASTHGATDENPLQDDEIEEEEDEEQRRTMAALKFELLKYLTDKWRQDAWVKITKKERLGGDTVLLHFPIVFDVLEDSG